jgi:transposase-like protein
VRKLTEPDKKEILKLYRETAETTSTLAERYDVSNSTISRLLKSTLQEDEYEYLVSLKRAARTPEGRAQVSYDTIPVFVEPEPEKEIKAKETKTKETKTKEIKPKEVKETKPKEVKETKPKELKTRISKTKETSKLELQQELPVIVEPKINHKDESSTVKRRVRKRSPMDEMDEPMAEQLELLNTHLEISSIPSALEDVVQPEVNAIAQMLGEEILDDDDLDDLDDEDDDYDDDDYRESVPLVTRRRGSGASVQVLPLSSAPLPKTCYLVIDRSSELITRPLREFGDLGQIPNIETQQRTLPIFDNHRVAKRFSTKRDRVIKVPDSKMLHKARNHLQAKGITRLLIDGQVYSLANV